MAEQIAASSCRKVSVGKNLRQPLLEKDFPLGKTNSSPFLQKGLRWKELKAAPPLEKDFPLGRTNSSFFLQKGHRWKELEAAPP